MKNLESPAYKLALFGALGSLGSATLVEALSRQWEATALLDDLNAIPSRPGIRAKPGEPFDALAVSHAVAGMDAVLCNLCSQPLLASARQQATTEFEVEFRAITALLDGLAMARVKRLLVIGDFRWLDEKVGYRPEPGVQLQQRLLDSTLDWTLVDAPSVGGEDLFGLDDFLTPTHSNEPDAVTALRRFAAAVLDECQLAAHRHQRVRIQG
ncbi:NAD(P)-dependent oxidoreductase [Pseudomonas sp. TUM22785]|uniref:NAD(P)-dependent oxidoreductase n=1 Tax=Pseudomonas sp. TUM22785 TaxID=3019098 RepID=UPI002305A025|nr:NAD(P)H-binding protein [Pseudomonas sp. TUM22785]WCD83163.1 NAD(P)H-binding protein [Pseudomonas sp. TUM22785]